MSEYDKELMKNLGDRDFDCSIFDSAIAERYFDALNTGFPIYGTQIKWSDVSVFHKTLSSDSINDEFLECIEILKVMDLVDFENSSVIYLGDSLTENAYKFLVKDIEKFIMHVVEIPQHHYFVEENVKWCIALNMTDDFNFGYSLINEAEI